MRSARSDEEITFLHAKSQPKFFSVDLIPEVALRPEAAAPLQSTTAGRSMPRSRPLIVMEKQPALLGVSIPTVNAFSAGAYLC